MVNSGKYHLEDTKLLISIYEFLLYNDTEVTTDISITTTDNTNTNTFTTTNNNNNNNNNVYLTKFFANRNHSNVLSSKL